MLLTDAKIRTQKPDSARTIKLADGDGLVLFVTPQGKKWWRFRYRFDGKEKMLSLGVYPSVSLVDAREKRNDCRKQLRKGIDPAKERKVSTESTPEIPTFDRIAREWHTRFQSKWVPAYSVRILRRLELDVFPFIGERPIGEITSQEVLQVLRRVELRTLETTHRLKTACSQIFRYAIAIGHVQHDPVANLRGAIPSVKYTHRAAPTDPREIAPLMRAIDGYSGSFVVKCALQLSPLTFVRPGELRQAEWSELDLDKAHWNIPAERMKMKVAHIVPLSSQAMTVLKALHAVTGHGRFCFPGHRSPLRCMSDNAVNAALRRMGFDNTEIVAHGFRAMARTVLDEVLQVRPDFIEHQLAHVVRDPNGRAYNRTQHLAAREKMMQQWADYLDGLKGITS